MKIFLLLFVFSSAAWAEMAPPVSEPYATEKSTEPLPGTSLPETSPIEDVVNEAGPVATEVQEVKKEKTKRTSRDNREDSFGSVMVGHQLISTWIPSKKTISYTQIFNHKWSLEGEYSWSTLDFPIYGVDLGAISEKRFSLMAHYYARNSFYFSFGAFYNDFEAQAGSDILNNVAGTTTTSSFGVEGVGLSGGMGNRWQWDNGFTLGFDWIRLNIPVATTEVDSKILTSVTNKEDDEDIRKVIKRFSRIPTFVLVGINLGYTF